MERRKKVRYKYGVSSHYPLFFWKECCICHKEFRREKIWETVTVPFYGRSGVRRYLCRKCAPTKDRAHEIFHNKEWIPRPGHLPPPPPPKRIVIKGKSVKGR